MLESIARVVEMSLKGCRERSGLEGVETNIPHRSKMFGRWDHEIQWHGKVCMISIPPGHRWATSWVTGGTTLHLCGLLTNFY